MLANGVAAEVFGDEFLLHGGQGQLGGDILGKELLPIAAGPGGPRTLAFVSLGIAPFAATLLQDWLGAGSDVMVERFVRDLPALRGYRRRVIRQLRQRFV